VSHRYDDKAYRFDEELGDDLSRLAAEKVAEKPTESGLDRIAKKKTPLDEVKAIIDASSAKSAEDAVKEHRVRSKLAEIRSRGPRRLDEFLSAVKK
jgi:hypothetical protein